MRRANTTETDMRLYRYGDAAMTLLDGKAGSGAGLHPSAVEQIYDAATEAVADHGLDGLSMEDIAVRAGCSRATVYRRVGGKGSDSRRGPEPGDRPHHQFGGTGRGPPERRGARPPGNHRVAGHHWEHPQSRVMRPRATLARMDSAFAIHSRAVGRHCDGILLGRPPPRRCRLRVLRVHGAHGTSTPH